MLSACPGWDISVQPLDSALLGFRLTHHRYQTSQLPHLCEPIHPSKRGFPLVGN